MTWITNYIHIKLWDVITRPCPIFNHDWVKTPVKSGLGWVIISQLWQWIYLLIHVLVSVKPRSWWRHQMETFSALLAICAGNSPVSGEFPTQRPVTRSFDICFDQRLNKRLSKQSWSWWFQTLAYPLWHHRNERSLGKWQLFPMKQAYIPH